MNVLVNGGYERESADAVLLDHYDEGRCIECHVGLDGLLERFVGAWQGLYRVYPRYSTRVC